jgi:hypothetical protein
MDNTMWQCDAFWCLWSTNKAIEVIKWVRGQYHTKSHAHLTVSAHRKRWVWESWLHHVAVEEEDSGPCMRVQLIIAFSDGGRAAAQFPETMFELTKSQIDELSPLHTVHMSFQFFNRADAAIFKTKFM